MTKAEKRRFIRELSRNVVNGVLAKVADMPDEWDGHELRRYLADRFEDASMTLNNRRGASAVQRKRLRDYKNEVYTRNL